MTFNELVELTANLDLESERIFLGRPANMIESYACFKDGDEWVFQSVTERQVLSENRGSEEEIVMDMYCIIKALFSKRVMPYKK